MRGFAPPNPVKCSAACRTPGYLGQKYGRELVFWGGGADAQKTMRCGAAAGVRREVPGRGASLPELEANGFNAMDEVQARTPVEHIVAAVDAVHEFNGDG